MASVIDRGVLRSGSFFNDAEPTEIVQLTASLPDRWILETTVDQCKPEKPRVRIRPDPSHNHHNASFSRRKGRRMTFVVAEEHASSYRHLEEPYADVRDVFDGIGRYVERIAAKRHKL